MKSYMYHVLRTYHKLTVTEFVTSSIKEAREYLENVKKNSKDFYATYRIKSIDCSEKLSIFDGDINEHST